MKRMIFGGLLAGATLAGTLALTPAGAGALGGLENIDEGPQACYEQVAFQEYKYTRTTQTTESKYKKEIRTETFKTEFRYAKYTQSRISIGDDRDDRDGPWGQWSAWTAWGKYKSGNGYSEGWGAPAGDVLEGPAPHDAGRYHGGRNDGHYWERRYRYQKVDQRQVSTGFDTTYEYKWSLTPPGAPWSATGETRPGTPIVEGPTDWLSVPPAGDGWVRTEDEQTSYENGKQIPCDKKPVNYTTYREAQGVCVTPGQTNVTVTEYAQKWTYEPNLVFEWVAIEDGDEDVNGTWERTLTEAERESCKRTADVTYTEWVDGEFECGDTTVEQTRTKTTTPYIYVIAGGEEEALLSQYSSASGGWVLDKDNAVSVTETQPRELSQEEFEACPVTPSADPPAQFEVASNTPIVPAAAAPPDAAAPAAPAAAVSAIPAQLPATGGSSWVTALIALVTLLGGTGLVRLSRRPTD